MKFIILLLSVLISINSYAQKKSKALKIEPVAKNVYQHISYEYVDSYGLVAASGLIVVDDNEAHIIDAPWSNKDSQKIVNWAKSKGFRIKSNIVSHFHQDASGGMPLFNKLGINTFASAKTNQLLIAKQHEQSTVQINKNHFEVVPGLIEVYYPGEGHSKDNVVIWLPKTKMLFGGCFIKSLRSKTLGNTNDANILAWPSSIDNVLAKYTDIEVVFPGHGSAGDISLLHHTKNLANSNTQ